MRWYANMDVLASDLYLLGGAQDMLVYKSDVLRLCG
jgi:hypothetical protein